MLMKIYDVKNVVGFIIDRLRCLIKVYDWRFFSDMMLEVFGIGKYLGSLKLYGVIVW